MGCWSVLAFSIPILFFLTPIPYVVGASQGVTVAGATSDPGPWSYQFSSPSAITFDPYGFMYVLDSGNNRVQKWWPGAAYGTTAIAAALNNPLGMTVDRLGNLVIADTSNHRVVSFPLTCRTSKLFDA